MIAIILTSDIDEGFLQFREIREKYDLVHVVNKPTILAKLRIHDDVEIIYNKSLKDNVELLQTFKAIIRQIDCRTVRPEKTITFIDFDGVFVPVFEYHFTSDIITVTLTNFVILRFEYDIIYRDMNLMQIRGYR